MILTEMCGIKNLNIYFFSWRKKTNKLFFYTTTLEVKFRHEKRRRTKIHILFFRKQVSQEISGGSRNNITPIDIGKSCRQIWMYYYLYLCKGFAKKDWKSHAIGSLVFEPLLQNIREINRGFWKINYSHPSTSNSDGVRWFVGSSTFISDHIISCSMKTRANFWTIW